MKNFIITAIKAVAFLMLVFGAIMFIVCIAKAEDAGRGFYTRDAAAQTFWYIGAIPSLTTVFSSFIVFGFSYIVEAACMYIDRCENEAFESEDETE